jgi:gamma-glutamyltranspeptidase / glutathione hydrolase
VLPPVRRLTRSAGTALPLALIPFVLSGLAACTPSAPAAPSPMSGKRTEGRQGMVSASHPDAAAAGAEVLRLGGNAIDAFAATAFALSVTDVSQTGLGGGGALTFYDARTRRVEHLSFYPRAGASPEWGKSDSLAARLQGRAAATPGMVAGVLQAHTRWGKLTRAQVMAPAIRLARDGFIVSPLLARTIISSRPKLLTDSLAAARFMPNGQALRPGERLLQPELAVTLERIARDGAPGFYAGAVAEALSAKVKSRGGLIDVSDMASYPVATMRPLCASWRGFTVLGAPPPMGGSAVLEMLLLADAAGIGNANGAGYTEQPVAVVKLADVMRIGNADAGRWRGDPTSMYVPARGVVQAGFAASRAPLIGSALADTVVAGEPAPFEAAATTAACAAFDPFPASTIAPSTAPAGAATAGEPPTDPVSFTSHLAVVDADGSAVSATTTVGVLFGSGVFTGGFFLNSAAANFDARTRAPNRYANSTMSPTLLLEGARVKLVVGAAGSQYIQPAIVQVTLRMLAYGEDPGTALAAPRIHASANTRDVEVEPGFPTAVYAALVARGYRPVSRVADITFGGVHAVFVAQNGTRIGVADPRRDGVAVAQ